MSFSVTMPALGESVTEGTVTRWLKQEGEAVELDEPLLEVSTDKVDTEIPSPAAGVLERIVVAEDETVEVGAELAVIGDGATGGGSDDGSDDQNTSSADTSSADTSSADSGSADTGSETQGSGDKAADGGQAAHGAEGGTQYPAAPEGVPTPSEVPQSQSDSSSAEGADASDSTSDKPTGGSQGPGSGTPVTMPALGESVTEGTVTRWLKEVGDRIEVDEPLLEVSTDKVDTEIPSPVAGFLTSIDVAEDETVEVGARLATISDSAEGGTPDGGRQDGGGESAGGEPSPAAEGKPEGAPAQDGPAEAADASDEAPQAPAPAAPAPTAAPAPAPAPTASSSGGQAPEGADTSTYVTPLVRKLAGEHSVDLSSLSGTGVGGRIRKQDVLEAAERARRAPASEAPATSAAPAAPAAGKDSAATPAAESPLRGTTEKMSRLRKVIAARMVESLQTSAQLTTVVEVDVTRIARLRTRAKADFEAREGVKLSFLPFFAKATVEALKVHPRVNSSLDGDEIIYHDVEHLGVAVDTERGLLVPVVKDAGDLNIAGLARKIADLAGRTRSNKVGPDELGGGTFTLTNTGSRGALFDTPIINQPQVAILGTGGVVKRPVVIDDDELGETIAVRSMIYLALSYDHRIVDGADAARFLVTIKNRLEEGRFESDLGL